jgi:hypothetical protein
LSVPVAASKTAPVREIADRQGHTVAIGIDGKSSGRERVSPSAMLEVVWTLLITGA